ncbi:tetratricopeptide repeat protein [Streptomyces zagrosensis]|uniref:Tetratricopeptide (TPR) repeat protein n=1 Tax=Streptomyces zagrosensis TaxID=1042984 RepID=A0A7W9QE33_9ACTN|nr:tetratricopeptide repeat protein [Streptomyces zagrosensis]MBB5938244.1 tetratricopeptide (TPR) repeat protein [Streptomyces zagrosensis]
MPGSATVLRNDHRAEAERLLARAVEEEVRRSGGRTDGSVLLNRARAALEDIMAAAAEEYDAYIRALDEAEAGQLPLAARLSRRHWGTPALVTAVAAATAFGADLGYGTSVTTALGAGVTVAVAGLAATVAKLTAGHWPASHRRAGLRNQPGGPEQLRLQWLTALEVRGIRPFLDQHRMTTAAARGSSGLGDTGSARRRASGKLAPGSRAPQLRGADRSAAARRRSVLEQSFQHLPEARGLLVGRRAQLGQIAQWVHQARASTETKATVVLLHGQPGSGRTTLAVHAAHQLRDQFRGACLVDLRGDGHGPAAPGSAGGPPLPTRDALLHLLNRLGAPRDQLLFRERTTHDQHLRRLIELYHQHLTAVPVTIVLDDASDAEQVCALIPERSDSLVLVTSRTPLTLPPDVAAWVHQLPVGPLEAAGAEELLRAAAQQAPEAEAGKGPEPYDALATDRLAELCGGLPLALRVAGSALGSRSCDALVADLAGSGHADPVERVLRLRYADQPEGARRLLRRLALAGRGSLGAAAAAALLATDDPTASRYLDVLSRAGLIQYVRGNRYRLHDQVRSFAHARLLDEEEPSERSAAQERLIRSYAELADSVIRLVDGNTSTRADHAFTAGAAAGHGFSSLDAALRWLDDESSFITATLRQADEGVDQAAVLHLLGALCDYCLLRGDLYRLGELSELSKAANQGLLVRSVQWRTGVAARQLGELDKARTTLASVVNLYFEAHHPAGAARALRDLGITLQQQGNLPDAATKLHEALALQTGEELRADRAWTLHALAAVERDRAHIAQALELLDEALELHREGESVHGQAWAHFQLGQVCLRMGDVTDAERELQDALAAYGRTHDARGEAWALTQLARARLVDRDAGAAVEQLRQALAKHRDNEDARGEAWTLYYLGQALEEHGDHDAALRDLERARTMFSRMRDVYGLACARHHSARVTRDLRATQTGSLRNSGFARQLLQDARQDFRRVGVPHGEAWSCVELAVIDAGNCRARQALELVDEAVRLFTEYGDRRGETWARFLRCTLLPFASAGGSVIGVAVAQEELAGLARELREGDWVGDPALEGYAEAFALILERGVEPETGWQAWRLGMVPGRHAREIMAVLPRRIQPDTA